MQENNKSLKSIIAFASLALLLLIIHNVLKLDLPESKWTYYIPSLQKLSMSLFMLTIISIAKLIIDRLIVRHLEDIGHRHNLLRVTKLISIALFCIIITFTIFQDPMGSLYSLGVLSLILGFSLQAPITSFIGWLYLIFRTPFQVGDRIEVKGHRGDVVEINFLDTSIMECNGSYLGNDRQSGRIIRVPNSVILSQEVINYSGTSQELIWNETPLQIAYTSDLNFVEKCLVNTANTDFEAFYKDEKFRNMPWEAQVYFRVNSYAWLEAVVSYPVSPIDTTGRRNRILKKALNELNNQAELVQFPEGNQR